jgi:hypothetical protein
MALLKLIKWKNELARASRAVNKPIYLARELPWRRNRRCAGQRGASSFRPPSFPILGGSCEQKGRC